MSIDEIRSKIGADSLHYISEAGLAEAIQLPSTCVACFNGDYMAGHPGDEASKDVMELPPSLASVL